MYPHLFRLTAIHSDKQFTPYIYTYIYQFTYVYSISTQRTTYYFLYQFFSTGDVENNFSEK